MWFHNYHNFRDIQKRLGIAENFRQYDDVHFTFRDYEDEVMKSEPPIYPLNLIALLERSPNFNFFSAFRMLRLLPSVAGYNHDTIYERLDQITFEDGRTESPRNFTTSSCSRPRGHVERPNERRHYMHQLYGGPASNESNSLQR